MNARRSLANQNTILTIARCLKHTILGGYKMTGIVNHQITQNNSESHFNDDYHSAEITILYTREKATNDRHLLFAVVELLPLGSDKLSDFPMSMGEGSIVLRNSGQEINLRRFHTSVNDAISWYKSSTRGAVEIPRFGWEKSQECFSLKTRRLSEEPVWPNFIIEDPNNLFWEKYPFWGKRNSQSRKHLMFSLERWDPFNSLSAEERKKAQKWFAENFPLDLFSRSVLWGSLHFILPNPIFSKLTSQLSSVDSKKLLIEIEPRPGKDLASLSMLVRQANPYGDISFQILQPTSRYNSIKFLHEPHLVSVDILCRDRGLLFKDELTPFISSIGLTMDMVIGQRQVEVPARSKKRDAEDYSVDIVETQTSIVGSEPLHSALKLVIEDQNEQKMFRESKKIGAQWFNRNVDEATRHIRELISKARNKLFIIDPYFGVIELQRFVVSNPHPNLPITVLTSAEFLVKDENGESLIKQLEHILRHDPTCSIEIRVMLGERPDIHDRFLVIDNDVWLLGSSLNEFAARGTMMVKLPYPKPIEVELKNIWDNSKSLDTWISDRIAARQDSENGN